jgi:hypothetical protein
MKRPEDVMEALTHMQDLMRGVMQDVDRYLENPRSFEPEYFRSVSGAAADAHLLATWVRDQLTYGSNEE